MVKSRPSEPKQIKLLLNDDLLDYLSYGIRTPVNSIFGLIKMLENEDQNDGKLKSIISKLKSNSHSLLNLTNDIVFFSKIEQKQLLSKKKIFNVNELITEISEQLSELKAELNKENIEIRNNFTNDNNFSIKADADNIKEILEKITDNALQHTKVGYIEIGYSIIKKQDQSRSHNLIEFYVKDTGVGISDTRKEFIFNREELIKNPQLQNYGGTGLGLAISKGLVDMLDGNIHVESVHGSGSTFFFSIPFELAEANEKTTKIKFTQEKTNYDWKGKTILIAEDIENNYKILEAGLRYTNSKIIWAKDGNEAIAECKLQDVDLILMDIRMPNKNGFEASIEIKQFNPDLPIIVLTACLYSDEVKRSFETGCNDYLVKPVQGNLLKQTIDKYI